VLPAKFVSPLKTAVIECDPTANPAVARSAWPPAKATGAPRFAAPSLNCTVPVGVPEPDDTVALNVTDSPNTDGLEPAVRATTVEVGAATFTI
jgi:hypothetical protein